MTLEATGTGYGLSQWTGDCSGAAQSVTVGMTADKHCEAIFEKAYNLKITKVGSGTVTSAPAGIRCGADCSEDYVKGMSVGLEASPDAGFVFTGWSGACSGSGSGTISSSRDGIGCSTTCSAGFIAGTSVSLFASPKSGSVFAGWGGDCSSSEYFANVTMTGTKSCRATFNAGIPVFITRTNCSMSRDTATSGHIFVAVWGFMCTPASPGRTALG